MLWAAEIDMGSQTGLDSIGSQGIHRKEGANGYKEKVLVLLM